MKKIILFSIFISLAFKISYAQKHTGTIIINVTDSADHDAIPDIGITLIASDSVNKNFPVLKGTSNEFGEITFKDKEYKPEGAFKSWGGFANALGGAFGLPNRPDIIITIHSSRRLVKSNVTTQTKKSLSDNKPKAGNKTERKTDTEWYFTLNNAKIIILNIELTLTKDTDHSKDALSNQNSNGGTSSETTGTSGTTTQENAGTQPHSNPNGATDNGTSTTTTSHENAGTQPISNPNRATNNGTTSTTTTSHENAGTQPQLNSTPATSNIQPSENTTSSFLKTANTVILFDLDKITLSEKAQHDLDNIRDSIGKNQAIIVGHADDQGNSEYNFQLAQSRANNVALYLATKKVNSGSIFVCSMGENAPIQEGTSEKVRARNRCVEIFIYEK